MRVRTKNGTNAEPVERAPSMVKARPPERPEKAESYTLELDPILIGVLEKRAGELGLEVSVLVAAYCNEGLQRPFYLPRVSLS